MVLLGHGDWPTLILWRAEVYDGSVRIGGRDSWSFLTQVARVAVMLFWGVDGGRVYGLSLRLPAESMSCLSNRRLQWMGAIATVQLQLQ